MNNEHILDNDTEKQKEKFEFNFEASVENIKKYFEQIKLKFPTYEDRISQKKMIYGILKGYESDKHVIAEAPTGTGKSLGYLLPFLSTWEQYKDEKSKPKLVVATNTIALQEQLINKDIPMLQDIFPELPFKASLVKGKSNYVCIKKYNELTDENSQDKGLFDNKEELEEFFNLKKEIAPHNEVIVGDKSDIKTQVSSNLWEKIAVDGDTCLKKKCSFYKECFFYKAKEMQREADILVANHALFFADLAVRIETDFEFDDLVLPGYDYLVFDEAHHIEDVACDFLGKEISRLRMKRLCSETIKKLRLEKFAEQLDQDIQFRDNLIGTLRSLETYIDYFCSQIVDYVGDETIKRLTTKDKNFVAIDDFIQQCKYVVDMLHKVVSDFDFAEEEEVQIESFIRRFNNLIADLSFIIKQEDVDYVYWVEIPKTNNNRHYYVKLFCTPIDVSDILSQFLFDRHEYSIVLTSATLGTDNVDYLQKRLGIQNALSMLFHSPFDYEKQSCIFIPEKTLSPKSEQYNDYIKDEILKLIRISKGRALVLFTSYSALNELSDYCRPIIRDMGYLFMKQGDLPKKDLIQIFKDDVHSVLFATASFWEGIDIPGEALSMLIITKLPFEVPDRPIIEARVERINRKGGNAFIEYQVPNAIIKFKQGFGRLIRKQTDKGVVAVLDPRIIQMKYGQLFLKSLPKVPIVRKYEYIENLLQ